MPGLLAIAQRLQGAELCPVVSVLLGSLQDALREPMEDRMEIEEQTA